MKEFFVQFDFLDIVLVCGLPGSGKSHFSRAHFKTSGRKRINRMEIRSHLYEMNNFGDPWKEEYFHEEDEGLVNHVERKLYEHLLFTHHKVLIDNTSVTVESRKFYVEQAQKMHKTIGAIFLDTPVQTCLQRNRAREGAVPDSVISNLYASIERPRREEGFKEVVIISDY